jgi:tetratricopeptide (TPR) repeat protein
MTTLYLPRPLWFLILLMPFLAEAQIAPSLLTAIRLNNPTGVQAALKAGANPNATDSLGATPLMWACYKADTTIVKLLIQRGAKTECLGVIRTDLNTLYGNLTGLAAGLNKLPLLRYLLETVKLPVNELQYNPSTKKNDGWTPVEWAANYGHIAVLTYLAERSANLNVAYGNPMVLSVQNNQPETLLFLLANGQTLQRNHPIYRKVTEPCFRLVTTLAKQEEKKGHYIVAARCYEQLLLIYGENVSRENADYATMMNDMGYVYYEMGQYDKARSLYEQCLSIWEKVKGKNHPYYTWILGNLAELYRKMGYYQKALPLYEQCLSIQDRSIGKDHPDYNVTLNNLAMLYCAMGQYEKALPLYERDLVVTEKAVGKDHPAYAMSLNNLATPYYRMEQYEQVRLLYEQCVRIMGKAVGTSHPDYAMTLNNLALSYYELGQYEQAQPLYEQCLNILEKAVGKDHPNYAQPLNNLGSMYQKMGQYEKARPLYEQCLRIQEKVVGKGHPDYATALNSLAELYEAMNEYRQAMPLVVANRQQYKVQLLETVGILNESALISFQKIRGNPDFAYSLGYGSRSIALAGQHYNDALLSKGVGLIAAQQINRIADETTDTTARRIAIELRDTKQYLIQQRSLPVSQQQNTDLLDRRVTELEQQLVLRQPDYAKVFTALRIEWPQIQQALKSDEAAIEFVSFQYHHKRLTDSTLYAALVLRPGYSQPNFVFLGEQRQLDKLLIAGAASPSQINELYRVGEAANNRQIAKPRSFSLISKVGGAEGNNRELAHGWALTKIIWQPLDSLLQGVKTLYVSPAGRLHQIALAALPNPADTSQRMADRFQIRQLGSTRVLALRTAQTEQPLAKNALKASLYGGIAYDADSLWLVRQKRLKGVQHPSVQREATRSGTWTYLKGTQIEVNNLSKILTPINTTILSGKAATEGSVKTLSGHSPKILHIATHGFVFPDLPGTNGPDQSRDERNSFQASENPLLRSGLVMAGANYVWKGGTPIEGVDDGILTAYELSNLNLNGTELVVLSACETGLGQIKGSEGVYGLQRAVKMAGARYLLMSLWRVPDNETAEYMTLLYNRLRDKGSVPEAYAYAQRQMRLKYSKEPFKWAAFVLME